MGNIKILINEAFKENLSESIQYHINSNNTLIDSIYRYNSNNWINLINEVRTLHNQNYLTLTHIDDIELIDSDAGTYYNNIPLDIPLIEDDFLNENPQLNKPKRNSSGKKKYVVYVKNPKTGNIKKISFGDVHGGLTAKINDPDARKAFSQRHDCPNKKDKLSAGYWACRLPRFAKALGLAGSYHGYW
jgi:hypothetical protein